MSAEVIAAIVVAVSSLIVAVFNSFVSRDAKRTAIRAEELTKRAEQLRIEATKSGEYILSSMTDIIIPSETILMLLKLQEQLDDDDAKEKSRQEILEEYFPKIAPAVGELRKVMYKSALYTTKEIRGRINKILEPWHTGGIALTSERWEEFVNELREDHEELASMFYNNYLKGALS